MSWSCEFWNPKNLEIGKRACELTGEDECPYPGGSCYDASGDEDDW